MLSASICLLEKIMIGAINMTSNQLALIGNSINGKMLRQKTIVYFWLPRALMLHLIEFNLYKVVLASP
jgi:hypothetical protein